MTKKQSKFVKFTHKFSKVERHAKKNIIKRIKTYRQFSRLLNILGPGIVTGAADDDCSGIATYSQAGAGYGYGFLWSFPIMLPLMTAVQESCSRIGAVTGKGLAAVIKANYSKKLLYMSVLLVFVANAVNIGADLGAMAATTRLFVPIPYSLLAVFYAILIILMMVFVSYRKYVKILKWLALALLAYPITAFMVGLDWPALFHNTFAVIPTINADRKSVV